MWRPTGGKITLLVRNVTLKKSTLSLLSSQIFLFFEYVSKVFDGPNMAFSYKFGTTIAQQFFLILNFGVLCKALYCPDICALWAANFVTQTFTPLRSKFYKFFFLCNFMDT